MARKRSKSKRKAKRNNTQANHLASATVGGSPDTVQAPLDTIGSPDEGPRRSTFRVSVGSPRLRYTPNPFSSDGGKGAESGLALKRNRHSLLPLAFETKRVEDWLNKGTEERFKWAFGYLRKPFQGFPVPVEVTSNKEAIAYLFNLPDITDAVKSKLFGQMTNAWNQKVKRAKRKSEGVRSVELSSSRMKELRSIASDAEVTVQQALDEIIKVAYQNKREFRRQSAKVKKAAIEKMRLEILGAGS